MAPRSGVNGPPVASAIGHARYEATGLCSNILLRQSSGVFVFRAGRRVIAIVSVWPADSSCCQLSSTQDASRDVNAARQKRPAAHTVAGRTARPGG